MDVRLVQGRLLRPEDVAQIEELIATHPGWSRWQLSRQLCAQWNWRNGTGALKDMAARTLLLKLQARGLIELPPRRRIPTNRMRLSSCAPASLVTDPVVSDLGSLGALTVKEISGDRAERQELAAVLSKFHYLGYAGPVGQNVQYTARTAEGRLLAGAVFGAAAWQCAPRDRWIGWSRQQRQENLASLANNSRFLILPWVKVPHLSSWILGRVVHRIARDWQTKYGHPVVLLETFVERELWRGTGYRSSNWIPVGCTTGRSRQDRRHTKEVPVKDVYLYPLRPDFREALCR